MGEPLGEGRGQGVRALRARSPRSDRTRPACRCRASRSHARVELVHAQEVFDRRAWSPRSSAARASAWCASACASSRATTRSSSGTAASTPCSSHAMHALGEQHFGVIGAGELRRARERCARAREVLRDQTVLGLGEQLGEALVIFVGSVRSTHRRASIARTPIRISGWGCRLFTPRQPPGNIAPGNLSWMGSGPCPASVHQGGSPPHAGSRAAATPSAPAPGCRPSPSKADPAPDAPLMKRGGTRRPSPPGEARRGPCASRPDRTRSRAPRGPGRGRGLRGAGG